MRLQKNTSLALYSVLEFAIDPTRHIPAAEIAAKYDVSPHHLAKVLSELARSGIVESVRGVGGGYRFAGNARRITLMDVIQLFEDLTPPDGERREPSEQTPVGMALGVVLSEIDEIAKATLSSITLATMLRLIERQQGRPIGPSVPGAAGAVSAEPAAPTARAGKAPGKRTPARGRGRGQAAARDSG
jgi:Rrf2 family protein